jgi:hypothetical protein
MSPGRTIDFIGERGGTRTRDPMIKYHGTHRHHLVHHADTGRDHPISDRVRGVNSQGSLIGASLLFCRTSPQIRPLPVFGPRIPGCLEGGVAVAVGALCVPKSTPLVATGDNWFCCARDSTYSCDRWAGGLMAMTEVEKSSRSIMELTFYTKLGPTPAFPPSPAETGQVKPAQRSRADPPRSSIS